MKSTVKMTVFGAGQAGSDPSRRPDRVRQDREGARKPKPQGRELIKDALLIRRVSRTLKRGRVNRLSVMVVVGNGNGKAAVATASASEIQAAMRKAYARAEARMKSYPIFRKTVPHDLDAKCGATGVLIRRAPAGTGIIAGDTMKKIFEALGLQDVVGKVLFGRNTINVAYTVMAALDTLSTFRRVYARRFGGNPNKELNPAADVPTAA